ncbi:unnamed protein product, partial [Ilex paraguariensis]
FAQVSLSYRRRTSSTSPFLSSLTVTAYPTFKFATIIIRSVPGSRCSSWSTDGIHAGVKDVNSPRSKLRKSLEQM